MTNTLFDLNKGLAEKEKGIASAVNAESTAKLDMARNLAVAIAREKGEVTADDVQEALAQHGFTQLGASAGSIFRDKRFASTGKYVPSRRINNHAHHYRVWKLA